MLNAKFKEIHSKDTKCVRQKLLWGEGFPSTRRGVVEVCRHGDPKARASFTLELHLLAWKGILSDNLTMKIILPSGHI